MHHHSYGVPCCCCCHVCTRAGIHPTWKQYVGERLGNSALGITYKKAVHWKSPYYLSAKVVAVANGNAATQAYAAGSNVAVRRATAETPAALAEISVLVTLAEVGEGGLTTDVFPHNYIAFRPSGSTKCSALGTTVVPGTCGWASIKVGNEWLNATITQSGGSGLLLTVDAATLRQSGATPAATATATAYAWAPVPLMNAYDVASGLPVLPWNRSL